MPHAFEKTLLSMLPAHRRARGFTLIEMLVVIGIIVVLAGILIPVSIRAFNKADRAAIRLHMLGIETALEAYKADFGSFPTTSLDATTSPFSASSPNTWGVDINATGLRGARTLAKALVGAGEQGSFASANVVATPVHVIGQDGNNGFGFRTVGRGGVVNASSKVHGPYLDMSTYRIAIATATNVDPDWNNSTYDAARDQIVILDRVRRPVLYYPQINASAQVNAIVGTINTSTERQGLVSGNDANTTAMYRGSDNSSFLSEATLRVALGDVNANGRLDAGESQSFRGPYILWSGGPDLNFATQANVLTSDDVSNAIAK